jgi:hypothetical protein
MKLVHTEPDSTGGKVLWIRINLVRIRILTLKPSQLNNWRILSVLWDCPKKHFTGNVYVIKDELDHFEEKYAQIIQISWQEGQIRLRIRPGQKVPDPTGFANLTKSGQAQWLRQNIQKGL